MGAAYGAGYLLGGERLARRLIEHYGPLMQLPMLGLGTLAVVSDPDLVKQVFTAKPDVLLGGEGVGPAAAIYGHDSMFVQEEPEHLRRRKLLTPPLHGQALDSYNPIIEEEARRALARFPVGRPFQMLHAARDFTLDIIVRIIFGVTDRAEITRLGQPFAELLDLALTEQTVLRYVLRGTGTLRWWPQLARINRAVAAVVEPTISQRRQDPELAARQDVLSLLMCARTETGEGLTDAEILADLITLMLAGHETTATTLAWMFDALLHRPGSLARVRAEADTGANEYTIAVINETMRLRPPVPFTSRVTTGPYQLGEHLLAPGTRIVLYIDAVNKNPRIYEQPDQFRPERFLGTRPSTYGWIPFGGGIKRCLGASFSQRELIIATHTLLRAGEFTPAQRHEEQPVRRSVVVVPRGGVKVRYRPL
ncbi:cytochrome P450 [Nocardia uniformis]|uniref:Cytochrome P450 n=1 Tax=Nocardia uniformis TaxID=53432 RepID=A0A849C8M6_9NOCA|nr:cytochrome P450 [Nocardia uniformis]NNH75153.1 cytochrome P450 [Nocardia uniformis]